LTKADPALYAQYKAEKSSKFLFLEPVTGLDGTKLSDAQKVPAAERNPEQKTVADASIAGDRHTLKADSFIPATMACIYLLILLYFKAIGGYKPVTIDMEKITGGIAGPMEHRVTVSSVSQRGAGSRSAPLSFSGTA
jgi:hypothetical protein